LLWLGNGMLFLVQLIPWVGAGATGSGWQRILVSLSGLVAFGLHVFMFAATP